MEHAGVGLCSLLSAAMAALDTRERPFPAHSFRHSRPALLCVRPGDVPAGCAVAGDASLHCSDFPILRYRAGGPRILRLLLFPDAVDGFLHLDRKQDPGRASGPHSLVQAALERGKGAQAGYHPRGLAARFLLDGFHVCRLLRQRRAIAARVFWRWRADGGVCYDRHSHLYDLPGRGFHARADLRFRVPLWPLPERHVRAADAGCAL